MMQRPNVNRDHANIRTGASVLQFLGKHGAIETVSTGLARDFERRYGSPKTRPDWQGDNEITLERVFGLCWKMNFKSPGKTVIRKELAVKKDALLIDSVSLEDLNAVRGKMVMALTDSAGRMLICGFQKASENMFLRGLPGATNEMWIDADGKIKAEDPDDIGEDDQRIIAGQLYGTLLMEDDTFTSATPGKFLMEVWASNRKNDDAGDMKLNLISIEPDAGMQAKNAADDTSSPSVESKRISSRKSSASTDFNPTVSGIGYLTEDSLEELPEREIIVPIVRDLDDRDDKPAPVRFGRHSGGLTEEVAHALVEAFQCEQIKEEEADHHGDASGGENVITDNEDVEHDDHGNGELKTLAPAGESHTTDLSSVSNTGALFDDLDSFMDQFSVSKK